ncbi:hypothetical protein HNR60_002975 [Rhodopseudomonas rhenobacensis]|uniref:Immunity MXAN-0049 protein domain-containing protein n=1 Tax=Rhodopseudomonas rhenobacensis TaxID=87461 RepID=A0A7W8DZM5_9BRAD|nr:DUF1629 domain-containing protein [Rhodopseudomonas rhenobacensis]MBB5048213.1 hypothetical protein [Rhodopseudomonas rhenobacensis]
MAWMMTVEMHVRSPKFDFDELDRLKLFKDRSGRTMERGIRFDGVPPVNLTARQQDTKKFCDAFHIIGFICVSEKFREIIEGFEPNAHQFFPITLEAKDGTRHAGPQYYIFNPCAVIDAYLDVGNAPGWPELRNLHRPYRAGYEDVALSSQEIAGRHVWMGGFLGAGNLFVSDALHAKLVKEKIRYLWFRPLKERDAPWNAEAEMPMVLAWLEADPARVQDLINRRPDWVRKHRADWML